MIFYTILFWFCNYLSVESNLAFLLGPISPWFPEKLDVNEFWFPMTEFWPSFWFCWTWREIPGAMNFSRNWSSGRNPITTFSASNLTVSPVNWYLTWYNMSQIASIFLICVAFFFQLILMFLIIYLILKKMMKRLRQMKIHFLKNSLTHKYFKCYNTMLNVKLFLIQKTRIFQCL